jgi:DNA-binding LacI/PurR family transcriptional regulator
LTSEVTLRDVAERAGVSIGTASQAINNRPHVSVVSRQRVLDAARELGYRVRQPVLSSKETELEVIGMITKHDYGLPMDVNPFYMPIQLGVERECQLLGLSLMYANIEVDHQNRPVFWPTMLTEQRIDGLLFVGTFFENTVDIIQRQTRIPIVLVDSYAPNLDFDHILIDNLNGTRRMVEHLIQLGHRNIGLIGSGPDNPPGVQERVHSFITTMQAHQLPVHYLEDSWLNRELGYQATQRLLKRAPELTALFVINDDCAIGAIHAANDLGLRVPQDISIAGFDDINLAREVTPPLTTVIVPKTWMGAMSVRRLLERAANPDQPKIYVVLSTELAIRKSVDSPRSN